MISIHMHAYIHTHLYRANLTHFTDPLQLLLERREWRFTVPSIAEPPPV